MRAPSWMGQPATIDETLPIDIARPAECPRYLGRVIRNVDVSRPTPLYMVERSAPRRYPIDRCGGGHHQLRDARARSAAARL